MKFIEDSQLPFHILIISLMKVVMYKVGSHFLGVSCILYTFSDIPRLLTQAVTSFQVYRRRTLNAEH